MKIHKTITIILTSLLILGVILIGTFALWWNGAFNKLDVKNIASYEKNGYTLFFKQH